jgi:hypothetical protein
MPLQPCDRTRRRFDARAEDRIEIMDRIGRGFPEGSYAFTDDGLLGRTVTRWFSTCQYPSAEDLIRDEDRGRGGPVARARS